MRNRHHRNLLAALAPALITLLAATTLASPASADMLVVPQTLASHPVGKPYAAMTPDGNALVVWGARSPSRFPDDVPEEPTTVLGSWRSPGGSFGPPFLIGRGRIVTDIVAAGNEGVVLAGRDPRGVIATFLPTGASRGLDQVLVPGALHGSAWAYRTPLLAADGAGNVVAALHGADDAAVAFSRAPGTPFGPAELIAGGVSRIATAMNAKGDAAIAMISSRFEVDVSVRNAGDASFAAPERSGITGGTGIMLDVEVTPNGDVAVADRAFVPMVGTNFGPNFAFRPAGGAFPAQLPERIESLSHTLVAGGGSDVSLVDISVPRDFGIPVPRLTDRRPDGSLSAPIQLGPGPVCDALDAKPVTNAGNLAITYRTSCQHSPIGPPGALQLVERPAGAAPTPPVPIGPLDAGFPAVASNGSGSLLIAWLTNVRAPQRAEVQAVVRDGPAELALLGLGKTLAVRDGRAKLALGCVGLRDCGGTLTVKRLGATGAKSRATTAVRLARGTKATKRVRLPRHALRGTRPRLKLTLTLVDGGRVTLRRSKTVRIKKR